MRARQRAERDAQQQAGVYLKSYSRSVNAKISDDEISAVTNNITNIVGEVHYECKVADLKEQYKHATTQAERDSLHKQMTDADRDFLAGQKLEEGNKLYYAKDYDGAIKLFREAIQLNPDWS